MIDMKGKKTLKNVGLRLPRRQTTSSVFPRIGHIGITFTIMNPLMTVWEAHRSCLKIAVFKLGG